jgi:hypothetical protein
MDLHNLDMQDVLLFDNDEHSAECHDNGGQQQNNIENKGGGVLIWGDFERNKSKRRNILRLTVIFCEVSTRR